MEALLIWFSFLILFSEYMHGGSIYDLLHKQNGVLKLPAILKVAVDVARGMSYLHQNNVIHRDLKAANLLLDENEVRIMKITLFFSDDFCFSFSNRK